MARRLVTDDGVSFRIVEFEPYPLEPDHVRVRVRFAAPKHGTESHALAGSSLRDKKWDKNLRLFVGRGAEDTPSAPATERGIGNMVVGTVLAVGEDVTRFKEGDVVFGYGQVREISQSTEENWRHLPDGLSDVGAVCVDPGHVAFVAVRDGNVRIGDDVAVFGLGAIGLLTVQVAKASGARRIVAVDPSPIRRNVALQTGATVALDPTTEDAGIAIKHATDNAGVDVAIETSGNGKALHEAIRGIRQCGTVVHVPWGPKNATDLRLDEEWHLNRPTLIGSQAVWQNPDRSHPLWDKERALQTVTHLLATGVLTGEPIVTPLIDFDEAPAKLTGIFERTSDAIKVGIRIP